MSQFETEVVYWHKLLTRVVEVLKGLSSRGLPFRRTSEILNEPTNGNYLMTLEFLAKFDPFLSENIFRHENSSYLSFTTCDEFISILAKEVVTKIVDELHVAIYFSFCVDSIPDIATNFLLQCDTRKSTVQYVRTFLASSKITVINQNT